MVIGKHSFKEWFTVTRYWSFPVSAMPVIATFTYLFAMGLVPKDVKSIIIFILSVLGVVILHASGNLLSDWSDYRSGVDNEKSYSVPFLVFQHFKPEEYLNYSILLFFIGIVIGIIISFLTGPALLLIGGIGVALTVLYAFLKYHALGDLNIFIVFSILPILGTSYAITGTINFDALVLAFPIGIITVSVLHANNARDMETDRNAGIKTFAMVIGERVSCILYCMYMILPFLFIFVAVLLKSLPVLALLSFLAIPQAFRNFMGAMSYYEVGLVAMNDLDQASAKLQLTFSGLLSLGLLLAGIL